MFGVDLRGLLRKLNAPSLRALESAAGMAVSRGHYEVLAEHILLRLLDDTTGDVLRIFQHFDVEPARVQRVLEQTLAALRTGNQGKPVFSPHLVALLENACLVGTVELGLTSVRSGALLLVIAAKPGRTTLEDHTDELEKIRADELRRDFHEIVGGSSEDESPPASGDACRSE